MCFKKYGTAACNVEIKPPVADDELKICGSTADGENGGFDCGDRKGTILSVGEDLYCLKSACNSGVTVLP